VGLKDEAHLFATEAHHLHELRRKMAGEHAPKLVVFFLPEKYAAVIGEYR